MGSSNSPPKELLIALAQALARQAADEDDKAEVATAGLAAYPDVSSPASIESAPLRPVTSGRRPARFTEADIKRAIAGVKKAGLPIAQVRIDPEGNITVEMGEPTTGHACAVNSWDEVLGIGPVTRSATRKKR